MTASEYKIKKLMRLPVAKMSPEEKTLLRNHLLAQKAEIEKLANQVRNENPFWFYQPVVGEIPKASTEFLHSYLKKEDIPQRLYGGLDVHLSNASIRGASGGNQSSKTTTGCIEAFIKATGALPNVFNPKLPQYYKYAYPAKRLERNGPQFVRVIGEDYQNGVLRNLIPTYRKWAPKEFLINGKWEDSYSAGEQTLKLVDPTTKKLCGTIEFMSNKQDLGTFQGPPRHMIIFDEEPDHEVYKENLMRFTTASSLDVLFCMTPTKGLSWTYDLFTRGNDESGNNVEWFQIASVCNPYANLKVLKEILDEMESYEELKMRLLGEFVSLTGLVYGKMFDPKIHVIPPYNTGCTCGGLKSHDEKCHFLEYVCFMGVDAHMVKDSCAVIVALDRSDNLIVDTCYKRGVDTEEFKRDLSKLTASQRMDWTVFDPSNDSTITVFRGRNIFYDMTHGANRIARAFKGDKFAGSIASGVDAIKKRLKINERTKKPTLFIMDRPENKILIKSFKTLQRDSFVDEDVKGQRDKIQEGIHDHHAALRYILQNRMRWNPMTAALVDSPISDMEAMVA